MSMHASATSSAPLHIVHVLTSIAIGGGERVALMVAAEQVRRGHRVGVVSLEESPAQLARQFEEAGVALHRFPKRSGFDPSLAFALHRFFRAGEVDVVHTHNPLPLIYAAAAAKAAGARVVHTKHGPHPDRAHRMWLRRLSGLAVNDYVAVSEDTAQFAREHREVAPQRLSVIRNGIDVDRFTATEADRKRVRRAWGVTADDVVVGTVGRMASVKNQALLLRALAPRLGEGVHLVIAGDGSEREAIEELAAARGVSGALHLLGAIDDVPAALAGFDLFALSSDVEGLPLAMAEAMAAGLPVVATHVGGVPKVVDEGVTGILVPRRDEGALRRGLDRLIDDQVRRRRMGEAGRARAVRDFSSARMVDDYMRRYRGRATMQDVPVRAARDDMPRSQASSQA